MENLNNFKTVASDGDMFWPPNVSENDQDPKFSEQEWLNDIYYSQDLDHHMFLRTPIAKKRCILKSTLSPERNPNLNIARIWEIDQANTLAISSSNYIH